MTFDSPKNWMFSFHVLEDVYFDSSVSRLSEDPIELLLHLSGVYKSAIKFYMLRWYKVTSLGHT